MDNILQNQESSAGVLRFHLIVGFSDKLRLMNLLMEDMRTYKDIPIKGCKECRFSHGGQFFAAVNSNMNMQAKAHKSASHILHRFHQPVIPFIWRERLFIPP